MILLKTFGNLLLFKNFSTLSKCNNSSQIDKKAMLGRRNLSLGLLGKSIGLTSKHMSTSNTPREDTDTGPNTKHSPKYDDYSGKYQLNLGGESISIQKSINDISYEGGLSNHTLRKKRSQKKLEDNKSIGGNNSERFPPIKGSQVAPGSYDVVRFKNSIDFNAKGYANGFLSKKERFPYVPCFNAGPGPGDYYLQKGASLVNKPSPKRKSPGLGPPKIRKSPRVRPLVHKDVFPGPGDYSLNEKHILKSVPAYKSIFNSQSPKCQVFAERL